MKVISIVAPASPAPLSQKKIIESFFKKEGFDVKFMPHVFDQECYLAGSDEARAQDLNEALTDKTTDFVVALRGGYGSPRILDMLDYKEIKLWSEKYDINLWSFHLPFWPFSELDISNPSLASKTV